jgi:hypothetical protein
VPAIRDAYTWPRKISRASTIRITSTGPSVIMKLRASRHFGREPHAAVNLQAAVGDAKAELGARDLGHIAFVPGGNAGVGARGELIHHQLRHVIPRDCTRVHKDAQARNFSCTIS